MSRWVDAWYRDAGWLTLLRPLEWLYRCVIAARRQAYLRGRKPIWQPPVPVIVVGNITLGGTGKSPLVAWLGGWLRERGWRPGIVSRGYGGRSAAYPLRVNADTSVEEAGDEPVMLAQQTGLPLVVDPDRPRGARALIEAGCNLVLADDGLQHLALGRAIELVVVDGKRGFGNRRCLPAGPLREPLARLDEVDALIINGDPTGVVQQAAGIPAHGMHLVPVRWRNLSDGRRYAITEIPFSGRVHALAGIGHPSRFFATLEGLGVEYEPHPRADHHRFSRDDLQFEDDQAIVMTAKDAVKCKPFATPRCWVLDVEAMPQPAFIDWLAGRLGQLSEEFQPGSR